MNFESWCETYQPVSNPNLAMLTLELSGQAYDKTEHRHNLKPKLDDRSDSAIERKHQNISAVLLELGYPAISGYKPLPNYQRLLFDVIADGLGAATTLEAAATAAVERPAVVPSFPDFSQLAVKPPERAEPSKVQRQGLPEDVSPLEFRAIKRDYVERETRNRSLGTAGELLVVDLERWRLERAGESRLAGKVVHVSKDLGDGPGFDVLSFYPDGVERYIEVKTTASCRDTPFFVTQRELEVSVRESDKYALYRLFDFRRQPRLFELQGKIADHCWLHPQPFGLPSRDIAGPRPCQRNGSRLGRRPRQEMADT